MTPLRRPSRDEAVGLASVAAAIGFMLAAHYYRTHLASPPFLFPENVPPLLWAAAAVAMMIGVWRLLGEAERRGEAPRCATCGSFVRADVCATCGQTLADDLKRALRRP